MIGGSARRRTFTTIFPPSLVYLVYCTVHTLYCRCLRPQSVTHANSHSARLESSSIAIFTLGRYQDAQWRTSLILHRNCHCDLFFLSPSHSTVAWIDSSIAALWLLKSAWANIKHKKERKGVIYLCKRSSFKMAKSMRIIESGK